MRWVDNRAVDFVSTVHYGDELVEKLRKHPRETHLNRGHVTRVWGNDWGVTIDIPAFVDDYNNMMGGIDKAYQMISYYRPKLQCRCIWMPMFFHSLDICRLNSYIVLQQRRVVSSHKDFILEWIDCMNQWADFIERQRTRAAVAALLTPPLAKQKKRMSHTRPTLPNYQFNGRPTDHLVVMTEVQMLCTYCRYLYAKAKQNGTISLPRVKKPQCKCLICSDHLFHDHFDVFHQEEQEE